MSHNTWHGTSQHQVHDTCKHSSPASASRIAQGPTLVCIYALHRCTAFALALRRGSGQSVTAHQPGRHQQQQAGAGRGGAPVAAPAPAPVASHAQLLANARRTAEPLTINGACYGLLGAAVGISRLPSCL